MGSQKASRAQQDTIPCINGKKRQRSSSSRPESDSKRRARSTDRSPFINSPALDPIIKSPSTPKPCETFRPENDWSCPSCGHRCWLCKLPAPATLECLEPSDEEEPKQAEMALEPTSSTSDISSSLPSSKKRKIDHYMQLGITFIGPRDRRFRNHILRPLGVYWVDCSWFKGKPPLFLSSQPLPQSGVVIKYDDKDLERIRTDFIECKARQYNEHSLILICCDSIILRDGWVHNGLADWEGQELIFTSVRRDKWKPQKQGPSIPEGKFIYDWDLEPDTTYAVSIKMFNVEYRRKLGLDAFQPWVAERDVAVCPYLTIEYKCSEKGGKESQATNQVVAAAMLWLHQRRDLRKAVGKTSNGLSHFMITLIESNYLVTEARLERDEYIIRQHLSGDLRYIDDLRLYIEWSNAIHAWGLGVNASSFKKDIETLVECRSALAPSNLPMPAGTGSIAGPPSQRLLLSEEVALPEQEP